MESSSSYLPITLYSTDSGVIQGAAASYTQGTSTCLMYLTTAIYDYDIRLTLQSTDFCSYADELYIYNSEYAESAESLGYIDKFTSYFKDYTSTRQRLTLKFQRYSCLYSSSYRGFTLSYKVGDYPYISGGAIAGIVISLLVVIALVSVTATVIIRRRRQLAATPHLIPPLAHTAYAPPPLATAYPPPPTAYYPPPHTAYPPPTNTYPPSANTYPPAANTYPPPANTYPPPSTTYPPADLNASAPPPGAAVNPPPYPSTDAGITNLGFGDASNNKY